jgi:hypothetical protein
MLKRHRTPDEDEDISLQSQLEGGIQKNNRRTKRGLI